MKKNLILAAIALVAVSCNKKNVEPPVPPVTPDTEAPISFGATANAEVTPSKTTSTLPTTTKLGVYAFKNATVPANKTDGDAKLWSSATNLEYVWDMTLNSGSGAFKENNSTPKLFWPGAGTKNSNLSFVSYFPYQSTGITDYVLTKDISDQSAAPDYGFAWDTLLNVARPEPVASKEFEFNYKVAKVSFSIVGDGTTVGASGIKVQSGGTGAGVVSVKLYTASTTGLYKTYVLNLLDGTTASSSGNLTESAPMSLKAVQKTGNGTSGDTFEKDYVDAVGYLAPSTDNGFKTAGITVAVVYNDGVSDQTYTATIKAGAGSLTSPADMSLGLVAGNNYKYTLKLGKSGITFTGKVTDWTDVNGGSIELQ